jgi:hypothetical protein
MSSPDELPTVTDPLLAERFAPYRGGDRAIFLDALERLLAYFRTTTDLPIPTEVVFYSPVDTMLDFYNLAERLQVKDGAVLNGPPTFSLDIAGGPLRSRMRIYVKDGRP